MNGRVPDALAPARFRIPLWLRYAVSFAVLGWVALAIDWPQLGGLSALDWQRALPAFLLAGLAYPLQAWRWQKLLRALAVPLPTGRAHALFWVGNFYNSFLPGGIAGDGVRIFNASRDFPQQRIDIAASVIADRLFGFGALLALAVLALGGQLALAGTQRELEVIFLASAGALTLLAIGSMFIMHTRGWDAAAARVLGPERARELRTAADALARDHSALLAAAALSVGVWLLDFVALGLLAQAVGLSASPLAIAVAAAAAYVAATLPISIGGHGVREGTLVVVLGWLGVVTEEPSRVTLLALAFWALSTLWSLAGALALFGSGPREK